MLASVTSLKVFFHSEYHFIIHLLGYPPAIKSSTPFYPVLQFVSNSPSAKALKSKSPKPS
jgi:hypothetical protein